MLGTIITAGISLPASAPSGTGEIPANALTLGGEPITLDGETLTLGDP